LGEASLICAGYAVDSLVLDFEADPYCHLEFLHFSVYDPAALFDYVEPVHVTHGMPSILYRGFDRFGETHG
jgi:hypothetical protein